MNKISLPFKAAGAITVRVLLGQVLAPKARSRTTAEVVANRLGIERVFAEVLPEGTAGMRTIGCNRRSC